VSGKDDGHKECCGDKGKVKACPVATPMPPTYVLLLLLLLLMLMLMMMLMMMCCSP